MFCIASIFVRKSQFDLPTTCRLNTASRSPRNSPRALSTTSEVLVHERLTEDVGKLADAAEVVPAAEAVEPPSEDKIGISDLGVSRVYRQSGKYQVGMYG